MKQYRNVDEAMKQPKVKVVLFQKVKPRPIGVMRPGKTAKDKGKTKRGS